MVSVCLMLAADRANVVVSTFDGALRTSARACMAGQVITIICNLIMVRRVWLACGLRAVLPPSARQGAGGAGLMAGEWAGHSSLTAPATNCPLFPPLAPAHTPAPARALCRHPPFAPVPACPCVLQLLYFGSEIQDLRRPSPDGGKGGSAGGMGGPVLSDDIQMASVSSAGPTFRIDGGNPFDQSV